MTEKFLNDRDYPRVRSGLGEALMRATQDYAASLGIQPDLTETDCCEVFSEVYGLAGSMIGTLFNVWPSSCRQDRLDDGETPAEFIRLDARIPIVHNELVGSAN